MWPNDESPTYVYFALVSGGLFYGTSAHVTNLILLLGLIFDYWTNTLNQWRILVILVTNYEPG